MKNTLKKKNLIKTNKKKGGSVSPYQQWFGPNSKAPPPQHNAGLYTGPAFNGPWGNIPVTPTTTNMINKNLLSANPPPGAIYQYPGNIRPGNNWQSMIGVNKFISDNKINWGPYMINCTTGHCGNSHNKINLNHNGGSKKNINNKNKKKNKSSSKK